MTDNNKEKEILFPFDGTNLKMTNGDPSTTPISHFITTLTNDLYTTNHSSGFQHNHEDFNYAMYLAVPVGAVLLVILLIVVVSLRTFDFIFHNTDGSFPNVIHMNWCSIQSIVFQLYLYS